jgi:hypothetical protein
MATMPAIVAARRPAHSTGEDGSLQEVNERARARHITPPSDALRRCPADSGRRDPRGQKCAEQPAIPTHVRVPRRRTIGTTIGFGKDFDEDLLTAMADAGRGNAHYAPTPDAAPAIFTSEFEGLMSLVTQNVSVEIRMSDDVAFLGLLNEFPTVAVPGGVQVQLGDAYGDERRRIVFQLHALGSRRSVHGGSPRSCSGT